MLKSTLLAHRVDSGSGWRARPAAGYQNLPEPKSYEE